MTAVRANAAQAVELAAPRTVSRNKTVIRFRLPGRDALITQEFCGAVKIGVCFNNSSDQN